MLADKETRETGTLNMQIIPFIEEMCYPFSSRKAGNDVANSLVTSALLYDQGYNWLPHMFVFISSSPDPYLPHCFSVNQWNPPLWKRPHVLYKEFQCNHILSFVVHMGLS